MKQKKFTTNKKLMASASMLLVSIMTLSSATYAWFTMNKDVTVTGMKLKATAEDGLVISDYTKANWATSWTVTMSDAATLAPTSTNKTNWATASSSQFDDAEKNTPTSGYTDLDFTYSNDPTTGEGVGSDTGVNYVLLRKFYIKGTGDAAWAQNLVIDEVKAEVAGTAASENLDKSFRVLVVAGTDKFIYAPVTGYDNACKFKGTGDNLALVASTTDSTCTSITSIPAGNTNAPIEVSMYMYFEGEDTNCKSSNISGIPVDTLTVSATFKTADITP